MNMGIDHAKAGAVDCRVAIVGGTELVIINSLKGTDFLKSSPEIMIKPSLAKPVRFADGQILHLNRRQRRRLGLYGPRVKEVKR